MEAQTLGDHIIDSGWYEATWDTGGQFAVAAFDDAVTAFGPDLDTGTYYVFRVRHNGGGGSAGEVLAEWYDGSWHVLGVYTGVWCMNADANSTGNCRSLHATLVHAENDSWFGVGGPTDGDGINHSNIQLRTDPNVWKVFRPSDFGEGESAEEDPYSKCNFVAWYRFRVKKGRC